MMGVFVLLLQTHLLKRGLATETYPQTLLSRFYFLQTITDIRNHDSWNSIEWLLLQPTVSYARLVCKIFCIANITTVDEWFICRKNIFTFQIFQAKALPKQKQKICTKYRKHWKRNVRFQLYGQTGLFLAVLKTSANVKQGQRRWMGMVGNCPPRFWGISQRGQIVPPSLLLAHLGVVHKLRLQDEVCRWSKNVHF